jgi:hypothetical protein
VGHAYQSKESNHCEEVNQSQEGARQEGGREEDRQEAGQESWSEEERPEDRFAKRSRGIHAWMPRLLLLALSLAISS